jgi:hypothetical protein
MADRGLPDPWILIHIIISVAIAKGIAKVWYALYDLNKSGMRDKCAESPERVGTGHLPFASHTRVWWVPLF